MQIPNEIYSLILFWQIKRILFNTQKDHWKHFCCFHVRAFSKKQSYRTYFFHCFHYAKEARPFYVQFYHLFLCPTAGSFNNNLNFKIYDECLISKYCHGTKVPVSSSSLWRGKKSQVQLILITKIFATLNGLINFSQELLWESS